MALGRGWKREGAPGPCVCVCVCLCVCVCGEVVLAREAGVGAPPGRQDPVAGVQASMWVRRRVWAGVSGGAGVEAQSGGGMGSGR